MTKDLTSRLSDNRRLADDLEKARIELSELEKARAQPDKLKRASKKVKELEEALEKGKAELKEELSGISSREKKMHYDSIFSEIKKEVEEWISKKRDQFVTEYLKDKYGLDYDLGDMKRNEGRKDDETHLQQETLQEGIARIHEVQSKVNEASREANQRLLALVREETRKIVSRYSRYSIITEEDKDRLVSEAAEKIQADLDKLENQENKTESEKTIDDYLRT